MLDKLAISILILFTIVGTVSAQSPLLPGKLAVYYGFPSEVNGAAGNLKAAAKVFKDYDIVIFGDGLQNTTHPDHDNTVGIISRLNRTAVYGYIPIGVTTGNLSLEVIQGRVDAWYEMGVAGIFLDEAGYDFSVTRQRQNEVVDYVHGKGLSVFINAWNPDDVFSPACHQTYNPNSDVTHLGPNDIYLLESFQIIWSEFQDPAIWVIKSDGAFDYREQFGTRMATVTTVGYPEFDQSKFDYAWWSTFLYGFDYMGWGELYFSASKDPKLPFHTRPNPRGIGGKFTSPVVAHDPILPLHTRTTTTGTIEVNTYEHTGQFQSEHQRVDSATACRTLWKRHGTYLHPGGE